MSAAVKANDNWPQFADGVLRNADQSDVRGWSSERRQAAANAVAEFNASMPHLATCVCCGGRRWSAHVADDGSRIWGCTNCHRPRLTAQEWDVERARLKKAEERAEAAKPKPGVVTPKSARATLASAIGDRDAARAELERLEAAVDPARETIASAEAAHAAAETALQQAQARAGAHMVAALLDGHPHSNGALRALRVAVEDAADALAAAVMARQQIGERLDAARSDVARSERKVHELAIEVLRLDVPAGVVARAERARAEFAQAMRAIVWLGARGVLADTAAHRRLFDSVSAWPEVADGAPAWEAALAELQRDANTPLPAC